MSRGCYLDKLGEMQVFVAAVKSGSFSAAGRQLELSPSTVSKLITRMESRLGARLLNRTTRTLSLTEGGQLYFRRCLDILQDIDAADDALSGLGQVPKGLLRINSSAGFARHQLQPLLTEYRTDNQQIHALYGHRKYLAAKIRVFVDFLLETFTPQPPWD